MINHHVYTRLELNLLYNIDARQTVDQIEWTNTLVDSNEKLRYQIKYFHHQFHHRGRKCPN